MSKYPSESRQSGEEEARDVAGGAISLRFVMPKQSPKSSTGMLTAISNEEERARLLVSGRE